MNGGISITLEKRSCKNLIFWICNMKQLNFSHFNTNSKFFLKETKTAPENVNIILFSISTSFRPYPTIPDYLEDFQRVPKIHELCRRFPKSIKDVPDDGWRFPRRNSKIFDFIFVIIFACERNIFYSVQIRFLHKKPSKNLSVFSPETIHIKKLANLTANTKRLDLRRSHEWFSRQIRYACATRSRL